MTDKQIADADIVVAIYRGRTIRWLARPGSHFASDNGANDSGGDAADTVRPCDTSDNNNEISKQTKD